MVKGSKPPPSGEATSNTVVGLMAPDPGERACCNHAGTTVTRSVAGGEPAYQ